MKRRRIIKCRIKNADAGFLQPGRQFGAHWCLSNAREFPMPRPRFQFRLRTLFVVVTAWAILCPLGVRLYLRWEMERERAVIQREVGSLDGDSLRPYRDTYTDHGQQ